jgi:hypothetical protein
MESDPLPEIDRVKLRSIARLKTRVTQLDRLCVRPRIAEELLSIGHKQLYELLGRGELESFKEGKARKITLASIQAYVARKLEKYPKPKASRSG